jgi:hypothetical protein
MEPYMQSTPAAGRQGRSGRALTVAGAVVTLVPVTPVPVTLAPVTLAPVTLAPAACRQPGPPWG